MRLTQIEVKGSPSRREAILGVCAVIILVSDMAKYYFEVTDWTANFVMYKERTPHDGKRMKGTFMEEQTTQPLPQIQNRRQPSARPTSTEAHAAPARGLAGHLCPGWVDGGCVARHAPNDRGRLQHHQASSHPNQPDLGQDT